MITETGEGQRKISCQIFRICLMLVSGAVCLSQRCGLRITLEADIVDVAENVHQASFTKLGWHNKISTAADGVPSDHHFDQCVRSKT